MNPIEEFYKKKETYELIKEMSKKYHSIYEMKIEGDLACDFYIKIRLDHSLFPTIRTDERWEIYKAIEDYIKDHENEIKDDIVKELEIRVEEARGGIVRDFKLTEKGVIINNEDIQK